MILYQLIKNVKQSLRNLNFKGIIHHAIRNVNRRIEFLNMYIEKLERIGRNRGTGMVASSYGVPSLLNAGGGDIAQPKQA